MCTKSELQKITQTVVQSALELMQDKIYKIVLYGSYARGDFDVESDVDIIILLDCGEKEMRNYRKRTAVLASRISLENDIEVSLLLKNMDSYEDRRTILPFYQNIEKEGIVLYGR
jgi:Predicted nucleotidyltransferases